MLRRKEQNMVIWRWPDNGDEGCDLVTKKQNIMMRWWFFAQWIFLQMLVRTREQKMWIKYNNYVADYDLFAMITMNICTLQISKSAFARPKQYGRCWRRRSRSHYFPILSGPSGEGCHIHTLPTLDDDQQDDGLDIISSNIYKLPHKSWKMDGHYPVNIWNAN